MMRRRHHRPAGAVTSLAHRRLRVVTASEAAKNFGGLVDKVREERAVYVVERAGTPVVRIAPVDPPTATVADLVDLLRGPDRLDERYLREVEHGVAFLNQPAFPATRWES
jgi:prevent-host-death family protein